MNTYVVNIDVELEATNAEAAEDIVLDGLSTGWFVIVKEVKEI